MKKSIMKAKLDLDNIDMARKPGDGVQKMYHKQYRLSCGSAYCPFSDPQVPGTRYEL